MTSGRLLLPRTDEILGFTAFGMHTGEVMAAVQLVMLAKQPYTAILDAVIAHPTMAPGLQMLFRADAMRSLAQPQG